MCDGGGFRGREFALKNKAVSVLPRTGAPLWHGLGLACARRRSLKGAEA